MRFTTGGPIRKSPGGHYVACRNRVNFIVGQRISYIDGGEQNCHSSKDFWTGYRRLPALIQACRWASATMRQF